jgi:hypothetical protein
VAAKNALALEPAAALRITNVALGDVLADKSARTSLKLTFKYTSAFKTLVFLLPTFPPEPSSKQTTATMSRWEAKSRHPQPSFVH